MIKKLKFRFLLVVMSSVAVVLAIIIAAINAINYQNVTNNADEIIEVLEFNNGMFGELPEEEEDNKEFYNPETPFETRFFSVEFFQDGTYRAYTNQIAAITLEEALEMAEVVMLQDSRGYKNNYRYKVIQKETSTLVIFVDWGRYMDAVEKFLSSSITIALISMACIFIVAFFVSDLTLKPIINSYEKQKRFVANASHEIKTPLTVISANNELIEIEFGENESSDAINKQIGKLNSMVNSLTVLSKLDNLRKDKSVTEFNLSNVVINTINEYKILLEKLNINISVEPNIHYKGNEGLIRQLISIILDNASKYALTTISISLVKTTKIEFIISNDTTQIEQGNLKQYLERFYRSSDARTSGVGGSGIGLSIAKEIVEFHKGRIVATGKNNIFTIKINL